MKARILKDTMQYSVANYIAMAIGILVSLATKSILGAVGAGYWALMKVFESYGEYSDLGTRDALLREIPQAIGAGDMAKCSKIQNCTLAFTAVMSFFSAIVIAVIARFWIEDPILRRGLYWVALLVIATHFYNFLLNLLRTLKKVGVLSAIIVVNMVLVAIFSVTGSVIAGIQGMVAGILLSTLMSAGVAYRMAGIRLKLEWDWSEIRRLIGIGLPMVVLSYVLITFLSIDSVRIGKMIGVKELGFYTIALMSVQQVSTLGRFTQIIIMPHIQEHYGRTGSLEASAGYFVKTTQALQNLLPLIIGSSALIVPLIVHYLLPRFEPGVPAMKVLVVGYYFVAVNEMSSSILFTVNRQKSLIPLYGLVVAVAAALNYAFIRLGHGICGVAIATSMAYCLYFWVVFVYSFRRLVGWRGAVMHAIGISGTFVYFALCLYGVDRWVRHPVPVVETAAKVFLFLLAMAPLLARFERREKLLSAVKELIFKKTGLAHA